MQHGAWRRECGASIGCATAPQSRHRIAQPRGWRRSRDGGLGAEGGHCRQLHQHVLLMRARRHTHGLTCFEGEPEEWIGLGGRPGLERSGSARKKAAHQQLPPAADPTTAHATTHYHPTLGHICGSTAQPRANSPNMGTNMGVVQITEAPQPLWALGSACSTGTCTGLQLLAPKDPCPVGRPQASTDCAPHCTVGHTAILMS